MVKFNFMPKEQKFFDLFEQSAKNISAAAKVLKEMIDTWQFIDSRVAEITEMEHTGDTITHQIMSMLHRTFVTPFDREDIHNLVSAIDDIVDYIHGATKRMELYKVEQMTPAIIKLSELIQKGAEELEVAVSELRNLKNISKIKEEPKAAPEAVRARGQGAAGQGAAGQAAVRRVPLRPRRCRTTSPAGRGRR